MRFFLFIMANVYGFHLPRMRTPNYTLQLKPYISSIPNITDIWNHGEVSWDDILKDDWKDTILYNID